MTLIKWLVFQILGDERGSMVALEYGKSVPFDIRRIYYIYHTGRGVSRGFHAHKELKQVAICISGQCRIVLDDGLKREEVLMNCPAKGLLIDSLLWREMHDFSEDCILLVLASEHYQESDYIRNYEDFLIEVRSANCS